MEDSILSAVCKTCGDSFGHDRYLLGYRECLPCGEESSRRKVRTVVPMHKSNYVLITDPALLKGINVKSGK
jgi:hypothetical protein